jgi:hypothetical protein
MGNLAIETETGGLLEGNQTARQQAFVDFMNAAVASDSFGALCSSK